ncbi:MAG: glycine--tRNA ligase subunit beta [Desulfovibrionaceae bacterium]
MSNFVLEIGTEELPARFLAGLESELAAAFGAALAEAKLGCGGVRTLSTPRRLAIMIHGLDAVQPEAEEEVSGPPVRVAFDAEGKPTKAAQGFAKTQGVDLADAYTVKTDKGEYLAVRRKTGGARTIDLLPALCERIVAGLNFPKKMRWGSRDFGFGRPVRWFLALLDAEVVPFTVADTPSGRATCGHRVMGAGPFEVDHADSYLAVLADKAKVVGTSAARKAIVTSQADELAAAAGGKVVWKDSLLDEVSGLVEYPRVILGKFDPSYLEVPREALLTCMESHQKSFGVEGADGTLLPHFVSTLNLEPKDLSVVTKGWERVLKARLEDARFFWKADLACEFDAWLAELDKVIFLAALGTVGDKSRRMEALCRWLAERVDPAMADDAARAGRLAKADLVSGMVGEFDELQGIMGGIYARRKGESGVTADAIYSHYLPTGPDSPVPATLAGALVSMADKADTLIGCFGLGMIPTGANDPYALRRCALGISRIIMEKGLRIDLGAFLKAAQDAYAGQRWKLDPADALAKAEEFVGLRLKNLFMSQGYETVIVDAALGAGIADVWALRARVEALAAFRKEADFQQAVLTFKRAANIIRKQGGEAGGTLTGAFDAALLQEDAEKALAGELGAMAPRFDALWAEDDFAALLGLLRELRPHVDAFFDNVMVMCDDAVLRGNRLNLLMALVSRLGRLADFGALQV